MTTEPENPTSEVDPNIPQVPSKVILHRVVSLTGIEGYDETTDVTVEIDPDAWFG